jgi:hypothetical protein
MRFAQRLWVALAVLGLHGLFLLFLWKHTRPLPAGDTTVTLLVFEFAPASKPVLPPPKREVAPVAPAVRRMAIAPTPAQAPTSTESATATQTSPAPRLHLRLPEGVGSITSQAERQPWERPQALATDTTQFDAAWAPDGDFADDLAWRSPTAALVMAVLGRRIPCTDDERRQRLPRCVPQNARNEFMP